MSNKLAASNIAWPAAADDAALAHLARVGFRGVEIAPAKVFGSLDAATAAAAADYRRRVAAHGLEIAAMQAILFGTEGVHLFAGEEMQQELARRLRQVAELAGNLGGVPCVFGAPRLRDPGELDADRAFAVALGFFADLAPAFADRGSRLCFEANPATYGCRFITHTQEALRLVEAVDHPGFGLQFDTGTAFINMEPVERLAAAIARAAHVHISEPGLAPVGASAVDHARVAEAVKTAGYAGWLSVEMKEAADWRAALETAHLTASRYL